ncbi:hypothetical protein HDV63DRAFT_43517 [Trichoderma sp. SZMC 28014]
MSRWMPRWSGLDWSQRARQGSFLGCIQRQTRCRSSLDQAGQRSLGLAASSASRWCWVHVFEHGEAEREAAVFARRPDYIQLAGRGDARPWPLVLPLLVYKQEDGKTCLCPCAGDGVFGCTKHPSLDADPIAQSMPSEQEALAQREGRMPAKFCDAASSP